MEGRVLTEILEDGFARRHPVSFIPSYESLAITPVTPHGDLEDLPPLPDEEPLMRPRLVLFDIDGTLLSAGGVSGRCLNATLRETFGTEGAAEGYDYSGKTDPQIVRELMRGAGFPDAEIEARLGLTLERYRERLLTSLRPEDVAPKPGVATLLEALHADERRDPRPAHREPRALRAGQARAARREPVLPVRGLRIGPRGPLPPARGGAGARAGPDGARASKGRTW